MKIIYKLRMSFCINVYILSREYPQSIYINSKKETLIDLYDQIYLLLNINEN